MPRRLAQQRVIVSNAKWPFHASRAIYGVDELVALSLVVGIGYRLVGYSVGRDPATRRKGTVVYSDPAVECMCVAHSFAL